VLWVLTPRARTIPVLMRALVHTEGTSLSVRVGVGDGVGRVVWVSRPFCRDTRLDWCRNRARLDVASDGEAEEAHEGGEDAKCVHLGGVNWLEWSGYLKEEEEKGDRKHRRDTCLTFKVVVRGLIHRSPFVSELSLKAPAVCQDAFINRLFSEVLLYLKTL
jgi:hypothetical protein